MHPFVLLLLESVHLLQPSVTKVRACDCMLVLRTICLHLQRKRNMLLSLLLSEEHTAKIRLFSRLMQQFLNSLEEFVELLFL